MNVNLHIREITLHGMPVHRSDLATVERAIRAQLESRFTQAERPDVLAHSIAWRSQIDLRPNISAADFGRELTSSLFPASERQEGVAD